MLCISCRQVASHAGVQCTAEQMAWHAPHSLLKMGAHSARADAEAEVVHKELPPTVTAAALLPAAAALLPAAAALPLRPPAAAWPLLRAGQHLNGPQLVQLKHL